MTPRKVLYFKKTSSKDIENFIDVDWVNLVTDRRSSSRYWTYVWVNLVTWRRKKQIVVSRSSTEFNFRGIAHNMCEGMRLRRVLRELSISVEKPMKMFCDNQSAISIAKNPIHHDKMKHVEANHHFIKEKIKG